jgi:hypothetical protein
LRQQLLQGSQIFFPLLELLFHLLNLFIVILCGGFLMVAKTSYLPIALVVELQSSFKRHVSDALWVYAMPILFIELRLKSIGGVVCTEDLCAKVAHHAL